MDTKKLRQKILDLAIHGKLVPQDPNDEPASVLSANVVLIMFPLIESPKSAPMLNSSVPPVLIFVVPPRYESLSEAFV